MDRLMAVLWLIAGFQFLQFCATIAVVYLVQKKALVERFEIREYAGTL